MDKILDKLPSSKDNIIVGPPRYDNLIKITDKGAVAKGNAYFSEAMGEKIKKTDKNRLFKEMSIIIEFYRFLYGVRGRVKVNNNLSGFTFNFICNSSEFLEPLYLELERIFGKLYISMQYGDGISMNSDMDCCLSVAILM